MEPNILWEGIVELGVVETGLVSLRLAFFLTTSKGKFNFKGKKKDKPFLGCGRKAWMVADDGVPVLVCAG